MSTLSKTLISSYYDSFAREYHHARLNQTKVINEHIEMPAMLSMIGDIQGRTILDIGCGSGIYTKILASHDAHVTALDISHSMIEIAKDYCQGLDISLIHTSFEEYIAEQMSFDIIIASFMLGYFQDLAGSFRKIRSLLKPGGFSIISGLHPIKTSRSKISEFPVVDDYFSEGYYFSEIVKDQPKMPLLRRTIQDICNAAIESGLSIEKILEPTPAQREGLPNELEYLFHTPTIIALKLART
ncbi:class I SAM-dependent methyltransferase [Chloroflexia bacterium SDU3-3]|nr:class I SAM-dependent methyltransferase [Chloroflexia bacterium SDU3-3]